MSQTVNSDELIEKLEEKRVEFDKKVEEKKEEFDKKVEEKKEEIGRKVEEKRVAFWAKMSSKIGFIMLLMVFAPMMMLTIISLHRVKSTTNSTYQSYSTNLAEQAEKGVFALSQFGINVYKSYATNLASEAVTGINASITSNIQIYKSIAQNLAEQAASGVDLIEGLNTDDVQTKRADFLNSIEINGVKGSYAYLIDKDAIILNHPDDQMIGEAESIVAVSYLASKIGSDSKLTNGCVLYSDRGVQKLAGYAYTKSNEVIIIAANYDDFVKIDYTTLVGSINISGVEGSFAFLVGSDNKIIWHPDSSLIGQTLSQDDLKKIVDEASKSYQEGLCGSVIYTENKVKKVAGYAVTAEKNILFVTADYDKFVKINYDELLGSTKIGGVDSSYAYMVDSKGVILWHPDESNIGKTADNEAVKKLVTSLAEKQELSSGTITYTDKEGTKLAGYALTNDKEILIVTADSNEFMSDIISLRRSMLIFGLIVSIIFSVVGYFIAKTMVDAIERIVPIINKTANLDLQPDEKITPLLKRRDEIGVIARSVNHMSEELRRIVSEINEARENINNNVDVLYNATNQISDLCSDNSATSEELAAGMEETTASTESIANSVESIEDSAKGIEDLALNGSKLSIEVMSRAEELRATTEAASRKTTSIYESVKEKSETAMEASKSVNKINDLTKTIMSISSQTSLLALNASIEAARAGEAGRGFAVVAGEIGNLATQTSTAVTDISEIVTEVNRSVGQLAECLQEAVSFLETNVLSDYSEFGKVSVQYRDDANEFKSSMSEINSGIIELNSNIKAIVESISGINRTVNESANGVNDIAQKTSNMVNETNEASLKVEECKECVKNLNDIVDLFQM